MSEYVSGEKHRAMTAGHSANNTLPKPVLAGIVIVVLMGLSFYGGTAYQKSHPAKATATAGLNGRVGRGRFGGQRPTIGQVTAVSASSITVQNSSSGASTTLGITSTTQITNNGQTVAASSIQTGDNVIVAASTTDKTQAARILVNPSFGGGGASSNNSPSTPNPAVTN
jgi:hypothetical protein